MTIQIGEDNKYKLIKCSCISVKHINTCHDNSITSVVQNVRKLLKLAKLSKSLQNLPKLLGFIEDSQLNTH